MSKRTKEGAGRRKQFAERYVEPLVAEATRLGIGADELVALIRSALAVVLLADGCAATRRGTV
jgi:DNA-binding transcriptional regulator YhcF (GntR family)